MATPGSAAVRSASTRALTEPTSLTMAPRRQIGGKFGRDGAHGADRHSEDHQFGINDRGAGGIGDIIGKIERAHSLAYRRHRHR